MYKRKKLNKVSRSLPESLPVVTHPVKSALLRKAMRLVIGALYKSPQTREMDEMRMFLAQETCLTIDEIDAALARLIGERQVVGSDKRGWRPSQRRVWVEGIVVGSRSGRYTLEVDATDESWLLDRTESVAVLPGDRVFAAPTGMQERGMRVANLQEVVSRGSTSVVCRLAWSSTVEGRSIVSPIDPFANTTLDVDTDADRLRNRAFVVEIDDSDIQDHPDTIYGHVTEILGDITNADVELEVALRRFELPSQFSPETLLEIEGLSEDPAEDEVESRVDLRDIAFVTIDGEDAKDFDDAVWCTQIGSGWRLLVAIADVSHYVQPATALDRDAQARCTSVYFPRKVIPMLPEKLSNGLCSLNPGVDRCTLVCDMIVASTGEVTAYQFYPAMIHSHARLTYTAVWRAINGDEAELIERGGCMHDIRTLFDLFAAFRRARQQRGAIDFETSETQMICDPSDGHITGIVRREHNDAHRLIEECMLAANTCAADFIERKNAGSLYRVHEPPTVDRLQSLRANLAAFGLTLGGGDKPKAEHFEKVIAAVKGQPCSETVQMAMLRTMQQAYYSPDNAGHYGLNYPAYAHFTSPIRRYPDLLLHRTIRALLKRRKYVPKIVTDASRLMESRVGRLVEKKNRDNLVQGTGDRVKLPAHHAVWTRLGEICSAAERRADEASRDVISWLKCMYMQQMIGQQFRGTITGCNSAGLYITLDDVFVDGFMHISKLGREYFVFDENTNSIWGEESGRHFKMGDKISVRVAEVDVDARRIDFCSRSYKDTGRVERFVDETVFAKEQGLEPKRKKRR